MASRPSIPALILLPTLVVALDQFSKYLITSSMVIYQSIPVVPGLFSITSLRNPGAAFSMFADAADHWRIPMLAGVSLLAVALLTVYYLRSHAEETLARFGALLVIGGALGNLVDRLRFGEVVDFLDFHLGRHHWPPFNVADSAITVGIAIFIWTAWRDRHDHSHSNPADAPAGEERRTP